MPTKQEKLKMLSAIGKATIDIINLIIIIISISMLINNYHTKQRLHKLEQQYNINSGK